MATTLNTQTIESFAALYDAGYDRAIFPAEYVSLSHLTHDALAAVGYTYPVVTTLTVCKLQAIMDWKWPPGKTKKLAAKNVAETVQETAREAFAAPDAAEAVRILCRLHGVGVPMSSAILTCFDPLRYTVIDARALNALKRLGLLDEMGLDESDVQFPDADAYGVYRAGCMQLADEARVSLRSLDRCLWMLDSTGLYTWAIHGVRLAPIGASPASGMQWAAE